MLSRISNTALKEEIEWALNSKFEYEYLYKPLPIIDGLKEASVCLVTSEVPNHIQYGIWGILPIGYKDSWKGFQSIYNTLEVECESINETSWLYNALKHRRCLIVATGYYTSQIKNHRLKLILNTLPKKRIFCFGGIYNVLADGFITCSILTHSDGASPYHLKNPKPMVIKKENYTNFLKYQISTQHLCDISLEIDKNEFEQHPFLHQVEDVF